MSASLKANEPSMEEILASIRRIIAEDTAPKADEPQPQPEPVQESASSEDSDVLDLATLSSVDDPDGDIEFREIAEPLVIAQPEPERSPEPEPEPPSAPEPAADRIPEMTAPATAEPARETDSMLLSPLAAAAVASAFGSLGAVQLTSAPRTLEDLVKDLLRPMLKGWLDENLPALVERLVRAEIERVSRGPRG